LGSSWQLESAVDAAKPAEMNSGLPEFHGGLRLASTQIKAATVGGSASTMGALSAALSGALIPIQTNIGNHTGEAAVFDVFLPLIPSSDGKDRSNNLSLVGEAMSGSGVGGLEYSSLTLGVPAPTALQAGTAVDSGIAGVNADGNLELVRYRAFRSNLNYTLPGARWATSVGVAQVEGRNLDRFSTTKLVQQGIAPKLSYGYASLFYDPLAWLRVSAEVSHTTTLYNDPANRRAVNNRVMLTTYLLF
jgi:hypothetical protein